MPELNYAELPQINLFGVTILEPFNILTNLLISAVCWYAFANLKKTNPTEGPQKLATYFFLIMGIATAAGGILGHGFLYATGVWGKLPGWMLSMVAVACMERAAIGHASGLLAPNTGRFLSWLNVVVILSIATFTLLTFNFTFTELYAAYGLFLVLFSLELYVYVKTKHPAGPQFFKATAIGALAAITHQLHIGINVWFNYNDVSHLIMALAVWYYYKAVLNMKTVSPTTQPGKAFQQKMCLNNSL